MRDLQSWLDEYGVSHKNRQNQIIHMVCVPVIMYSILAMLWCIPRISFMDNFQLINWSTLFSLVCLVFYISLSFKTAIKMIFFIGPMLVINYFWYQASPSTFLYSSIVLFVLAWIGQFYGHKIEGKKPSFLKDLLFLFIGPLWVLKEYQELLENN